MNCPNCNSKRIIELVDDDAYFCFSCEDIIKKESD